MIYLSFVIKSSINWMFQLEIQLTGRWGEKLILWLGVEVKHHATRMLDCWSIEIYIQKYRVSHTQY
jgi:hypothetical protein